MKKIGFFGGSFDPVHFGHLHLAIDLLEQHGLDEVLFCPAYCSPFKTEHPPVAAPKHRLEMLKLVVAEIPQFRVTPIEVEQPRTSYTIDTLQKLERPDVQYRLFLTKESAATYSQWKDSAALQRLAPLLIGDRIFPISSTQVRRRLEAGRYCGHLIPKEAIDYIRQHRLYCTAVDHEKKLI